MLMKLSNSMLLTPNILNWLQYINFKKINKCYAHMEQTQNLSFESWRNQTDIAKQREDIKLPTGGICCL